MPVRFHNPYLLLTLAALFWSGNMVVGRAMHGEVPPFALAFWRWVIALLLTLPPALPHWRDGWPRLRKEWKAVAALGLLGVGGYNTFTYIALQYTGATNASLLNSFCPVATIALSWAFFGKRLSGVEWLGVLASLVGVAVIVSRGEPATLLALAPNVGDLWMLTAVLVWALYTIGLQWRPAGVPPMLLLAALMTVGLLALTPFYAWEMAQGRRIVLSASSVMGIAYVGTLPSFAGFIFYNRAVGEVGASKASLFLHLMPVFGTLLATLFLGETPRLFHGIGIGLIFLGIYLATANRAKPRENHGHGEKT
ncbi:MAG: DMT family transporter [Candidatus Accumulibacter sp.]|jgi:drug/metabolite transporter (DMT)-like permease|nr:DMT family transporter [Accumulibacter sp.]